MTPSKPLSGGAKCSSLDSVEARLLESSWLAGDDRINPIYMLYWRWEGECHEFRVSQVSKFAR